MAGTTSKQNPTNFWFNLYETHLVRDKMFPVEALKIHSKKVTESSVIANVAYEILKNSDVEKFLVFFLNSSNNITGVIILTTGILNSSIVHPREVFKAACLASAAGIVLCHNHPSGATEPSQEDKIVTKKLVEAGKMMDIPIVDHVIVPTGPVPSHEYFSFADMGLIQHYHNQ